VTIVNSSSDQRCPRSASEGMRLIPGHLRSAPQFRLPFSRFLVVCLLVSETHLGRAFLTTIRKTVDNTMRARLSRKCKVDTEVNRETEIEVGNIPIAPATDAVALPGKRGRKKNVINQEVKIGGGKLATAPALDTVALLVKREKKKNAVVVPVSSVGPHVIESMRVKTLKSVRVLRKSESDGITGNGLLIDLGNLTPMVVISRPSQSIKTPYVADLMIKDAQYNRDDFMTGAVEQTSSSSNGSVKKATKKNLTDQTAALSKKLRLTVEPEDVHLGHTPALDCAGMIVPGAVVYCTPNDSHTKTKFTVQLCEEQREDGGVVTVACHPNLAERAARVLLEEALLTEELGYYDITKVLRQQTFGKSRVDFVVQSFDGKKITLVEVKNVVGADYMMGAVPSGRSTVGVYTVPPKQPDGSDYERHAIFPHGSKKAEIGVVSDRAIKHVHELNCMHDTVDSEGRKIKSAILFIINRSDCEAFRPCHEADMVFAQMLLRASEKGVLLIAKEVIWSKGVGRAGRTLPVTFHSSVSSNDIDELHLQRILLFNENGSGRSPSPSSKKTPADGDLVSSKKKKIKL
jgi:DNA-binding sugar fermentation-stimulating protein